MADPTTTQPDAPAVPDSQAPAVDVETGTQQPNLATAIQGSMQPFQNAEQDALKRATDIANAPAPTKPVPHARLLAMIQGLGIGLSAAGTSIATHGREGGAPQVEQEYAQIRQAKREDASAAQALKNSQIQQQMTVADTNHKLAQNVLLMATLPNVLRTSDVHLAQAEQGLEVGKADLAKTQAEFMSNFGMSPDAFDQMLGSGNPAQGGTAIAPEASQALNSFLTQKVQFAAKVLPSDDPYLSQAQAILGNPNSTAQQKFSATASLNRQIALQTQADEIKAKKNTLEQTGIYAKLSTPEALAAPGAHAAIKAAIANPNTDPVDVPRLNALLGQADLAQQNALRVKNMEKQAEQAITQGDPAQAGALLANRSLTLSELKSRQVTPAFIEAAVNAAQKIDPTFKPAEADAQAKIAGAPSNQQFFGNTDSLLIKGGTLDQLKSAYDALGNTPIPAWNTVEQVAKAAAGSGPLARLAAVTLGVADDYSKVMSQGGSDTSRAQAFEVIKPALSPDAQAQTLDAIRKQVTSQRNGRIGQNPYMKDMYPDPSTMQENPGIAGTTPAKASYNRPPTVSAQAKLMQVGDYPPVWVEPANQSAAAAKGAKEVPGVQ